MPQFVEAAVENSVHGGRRQESVQNHTLEQMVDFPAPPNMEVYAGRVRAPPQERVQNRVLEPVVDVPLPHIKQGAVSTGKVFTVNLRHHRDDQAFSDCVGFIRTCLDLET